MNIQGLLFLKEKKLPLMRKLFIFRKLSEIPNSHLDAYDEKKKWAMRGFDDHIKIKDSPYKIKDFRFHGFSKKEIKKIFEKINSQMDKEKIPKKHRLFLICEVFYDKDVKFSGHVIKENDTLHIDIINSNRPSMRDWTPDISFQINVKDGKPNLIPHGIYRPYIIKICRDLIKLPNKSYADFTLFKDSYFFYHDFSIII